LLWNGKLQKRPKPRVFDSNDGGSNSSGGSSSVDSPGPEDGSNGSSGFSSNGKGTR
jgi:hypothetical protein